MAEAKKKYLVTGGLGYIGSHVCVELLNQGFDVTVIDNLCNSKIEVLERIEYIGGRGLKFVKLDVCDYVGLRDIFSREKFNAVLHFAGLKAVGESVRKPILYYRNNLISSMTLCQVMEEFGVRRLVFSSSAAVYGTASAAPFGEDAPPGPANSYGRSKLMVEDMLRDLATSDARWQICLLRYFNPVGAHPKGVLGEDPTGTPNNLMPYICQVAVGILKELQVYGDDYPTTDGTGVRDYIHVVDLAHGHVAALNRLSEMHGAVPINLGTGRGYSVLEVVRPFEIASGKKIPFRIVARRAGDIAMSYADPALAQRLLGRGAKKDLKDMCADAWRWQDKNPQGFMTPIAVR